MSRRSTRVVRDIKVGTQRGTNDERTTRDRCDQKEVGRETSMSETNLTKGRKKRTDLRKY